MSTGTATASLTFAALRAADVARETEDGGPVDLISREDRSQSLATTVLDYARELDFVVRAGGSSIHMDAAECAMRMARALSTLQLAIDRAAWYAGVDLEAATIARWDEESRLLGSPLRLGSDGPRIVPGEDEDGEAAPARPAPANPADVALGEAMRVFIGRQGAATLEEVAAAFNVDTDAAHIALGSIADAVFGNRRMVHGGADGPREELLLVADDPGPDADALAGALRVWAVRQPAALSNSDAAGAFRLTPARVEQIVEASGGRLHRHGGRLFIQFPEDEA